MKPVVAIIAPGAMGAAVAQRLTENGLEVRTLLEGRGDATLARASAAGMRAVDEVGVAEADILLSILPPGEAISFAERLAPVLARGNPRLVYADCNAVSPRTVLGIGEIVAAAGVRFVDAAIIGGPPRPGTPGPVFYASGPHAPELKRLALYGLIVKTLDAPLGGASGLKMSYAGITKGSTALAAAMILAATRYGIADGLREELADSQPEMLGRFRHVIPDMYPKAYRWVAEMEEIAAFASEDPAAQAIFMGIAELYGRLARDQAGGRGEIGALSTFLDP